MLGYNGVVLGCNGIVLGYNGVVLGFNGVVFPNGSIIGSTVSCRGETHRYTINTVHLLHCSWPEWRQYHSADCSNPIIIT